MKSIIRILSLITIFPNEATFPNFILVRINLVLITDGV